MKLGESLMKEVLINKRHIFDVWMMEESDNVQRCAMAFCWRMVFRTCINQLNKIKQKDSYMYRVLYKCVNLTMLYNIQKNIGYLLTNGLITIKDGKLLENRIDALCKSIAPGCLSLTGLL